MKYLFRNRILACFMACAMIMCFTSGCGKNNGRDVILYDGEESSTDGRISVSFFGFKADAINLTAIESALQGYMQENPDINITYESIKGSPYWEALDRRYESGKLDDVFMSKESYILAMSAEGSLADLSGLQGVDGFSDQAREQFTSPDGAVYFLPTCISTYNLYINYNLLEAHGQKIPKDLNGLRQVCDYFVSQGIVPIIANNNVSLPSLITGKGLFDVYQSSDVDAAMAAFNQNPALLAKTLAPGVELVADMIERGWIDPEEVLKTNSTSDDLLLFAQGDRPFMISGGWASVRVSAMEQEFSYGVHPYPILDDGSVLSMQVDTCIVVNAASEHLEEAKDFVEYLIRPDVMWAYCDSQASYTPLRNETRVPSQASLIPSTEYLTNGRISMRSEYRLELPLEKALKDCTNVLLNGGTVTQAQAVLAESLGS